MKSEALYEFAEYRLDPIQGALITGATIIPLDPQTCEVLRVFLKNPQRELEVDFLIKEAWADDLDTSNEAVSFQIYQLRGILRDDAKKPRFIKTLRGREPLRKLRFKFLQDVRKVGATGLATELYEKARYFFHKSAPHHISTAIKYFGQVIDLDREWVADAHAGVAESFVLLGTFAHQVMPAADAMSKARIAALQAIALDDRKAEAHSALASIAALYDWQWQAAVQHFAASFNFSTNPLVKPMVRSWYALCLAARGEAVLARQEIQQAKADYPSSFVIAALSGRIAYLAHDPELAVTECDDAIALEEHFFMGHLFKGHALRQLRRYDLALASFQKACELSGNNPVILAEVANIYALQRRYDESQTILQQLEHTALGRYVSPHVFAMIALGYGEHEKALDFLERTLHERGAYLIALTTDPVYDPLRGHPRFIAILRNVGFAQDAAPPASPSW